jgi:hypothetical protein
MSVDATAIPLAPIVVIPIQPIALQNSLNTLSRFIAGQSSVANIDI